MQKIFYLIGKIIMITIMMIFGIAIGFYGAQRIIKCKIMIKIRENKYDKELLKNSYRFLCKKSMGKPFEFSTSDDVLNSKEFKYAKELFEYTTDFPLSWLLFKYNPCE